MLIGALASRTAPPRRRLRSPLRGRGRALLCLTAVAALAAGTGVQSTLAAFTDTAPVTGTSISTGTIDVTLWGFLGGPGNIDGNLDGTAAAWVLPNAAPGETESDVIRVDNAGNLPLVYDVTATATGGLTASSGLKVFMVKSANLGTVDHVEFGTAGENNRRSYCGSTAVTEANSTAVTSTPTTFYSNQALAVGAQEYFCIAVIVPDSAGNALQGATGVAKIKWSARQAS